jgi:hypothetical protein
MIINEFKFKNNPKKTFFAPEWDYSFYETYLENVNLDLVAKIILKKEKEIKTIFNDQHVLKNRNKKEGSVDGYTGLGEKSLTARYPFFNVFSWNDKEIVKIKNQVLNFYLEILKLNNAPRINSWIQCWANVMRYGEQILPHIHSTEPETYLGGHITIQASESYTGYICPINQINEPKFYKSTNEIGKITIFPNNIPHFTSKHYDKINERITIAFDIEIQKFTENHIELDIL